MPSTRRWSDVAKELRDRPDDAERMAVARARLADELTTHADVLATYARWHRSGNATMKCTPSAEEIEQRGYTVWTGSDGKVIYDSLALAQAAADAFLRLEGKHLVPYPCARSKHGHYHLTSEGHTRPKCSTVR